MSAGIDEVKAEVRKLSAAATKLKMDLHDLAEELPVGWQDAVALASRAEDAFRRLEAARARLRALEGNP